MKFGRQDAVALAAFVLIALVGLSLWSGQGPVVWLNQFAIMCGF